MDQTTPRLSTDTGQLRSLLVPETVEDLEALGFSPYPIVGQTAFIGGGADGPLVAEVAGVSELDGLRLVDAADPEPADPDPADAAGTVAAPHPNGVTSIDHVVVMTPNADRTQSAFEAAGFETRRVRRFETADGPRRQMFYWLGDVICEVVGHDETKGDGPSKWWGLALTVADIDATAEFFGDECTRVKDAVQPGRRVSTLKSARSRTPIMFISPHQPS